AVAGAGLAATALDIEGEAPGGVAADLRLGRLGEQRAHPVPHAGVGGGVRARGAADGRLVHVHHLVEVLEAGDPLVAAGHDAGAVELLGEHRVQDVVDQRGLPGAGDAGDGGEHAEREGDVLPGEVVRARGDDL